MFDIDDNTSEDEQQAQKELLRRNKKRRRQILKNVFKINRMIEQDLLNAKTSNLVVTKRDRFINTARQDITYQKIIRYVKIDGIKNLYMFKEDLRTE